jgi:ribosomal protein S18 acetylase RimI-like enzyme
MAISIATKEDIPGLLNLINSAYRGEESKKGWTSEAHLLRGELRADESMLWDLMKMPTAAFLKSCNETGQVDGCVFLDKQGNRLYLGMLSVSPLLQAKGIGKLLLLAAEEYAQLKDCGFIFMRVISVRHELIDWYERKGYYKTGQTEAFPGDGKFGVATQPLEFLILEKKIDKPS